MKKISVIWAICPPLARPRLSRLARLASRAKQASARPGLLAGAIWAICGFFCFSGVSLADDMNTPTGMAAYLKNKQLPTLKTID